MGTNGIQAIDLVTRKLTTRGVGLMADFLARLDATDGAPGAAGEPLASTHGNLSAADATLLPLAPCTPGPANPVWRGPTSPN